MNHIAHTSSLSELIAQLNREWQDALFRDLLRTFLGSQLGIIVVNKPAGVAGKIVSTKSQPFTLGSTTHGDAKSRVLAFADPQAFRARFGEKFNGEMSGIDIFKTAEANSGCAGVLVNGALGLHSFAIDQAAIRWALAQQSVGLASN